MALTYQLIARAEPTSGNVVSFTSIPQTYTDLRLTFSVIGTATTGDLKVTFNNDTANNYSETTIQARYAASTLNSTRYTDRAYLHTTVSSAFSSLYPFTSFYDIMGYTMNTNKTILMYGGITAPTFGDWHRIAGYWRNTSAIDRIDISLAATGESYSSGTTFSLYGIKAA